MIYGASGSLGTAAVQLAKHFGAHVTARLRHRRTSTSSDRSAPTRSSTTARRTSRRHGPTYDAIIDAVGKYSFRRGRRALKPGGIYVATDGGRFLLETLTFVIATRWRRQPPGAGRDGRRSKDDVLFLKELIEAGEFRAVIDRRFPMTQVAEAHRYVEGWHKTGNVVLVIADDPR